MHGVKPRGNDPIWAPGFLPKVFQPTTIDGRSAKPIENLARLKSMSTEPVFAVLRERLLVLAEDRARADAGSDAVTIELARNLQLARNLGFSGTPGFIAGGTPIPGAIGYDRLKELIDSPQG